MPAEFKPATRKQVKLKLAITGPSGSGKTMSSLLIAFGIGKKVALVDTENQSASLYADMKEGPLAGLAFDTLDIHPPYTIAKYVAAIEAAEKAGYDVLVIDSISHAWAGEGGLLSKKEALDQRGGNQYTNWASITKEQEQFKARLLASVIHIICTMRSKQDYILEVNDKGKQTPKKVGMAPIQREGMDYEFTTVFDMAMDHHAIASKDRTAMWDGQVFKPGVDTGQKFMEWLKSGRPVPPPATKPGATTVCITDPPSTEDQTPDEVRKGLTGYILESLKVAAIPEQDFLGWLFVIQGDKKKHWVNKAEDEPFTLDGKIEDISWLANKTMLHAAIGAFNEAKKVGA